MNVATEGIPYTGCKDSHILRDGVCDDNVNTPMCLYDGGDCCLEDKAVHPCRVCSCILEVNEEELTRRFLALGVKAFKNPARFEVVVSTVGKTVLNVVSKHVCSMICLDDDIFEPVNAWHYDILAQVCSCGWIDYHTNEWFRLISYNESAKHKLTNAAYVQTTRLLLSGI